MSPALRMEAAKLERAVVTRVTTLTCLAITTAITLGGFLAARQGNTSPAAIKARALVSTLDWAGYTTLAVTVVGVVTVLGTGVLMSWVVGREFTEGTVVSLFGLPVTTARIGSAKLLVCAAWAMRIVAAEAVLIGGGGVVTGLPASGVVRCAAVVGLVGLLLSASMTPILWVATRSRGYLGGIAATLAVVVVTNLVTGFGGGRYLPWAVPILWATPGSSAGAGWLALPAATSLLGAGLTLHSWRTLQLGDR